MSATAGQQLAAELRLLLRELAGMARCSGGRRPLLVIGCSSSEIAGQRIGRASQPELAGELAGAALAAAAELDLDLAVQCCEHLNRALVVERETALAHGLTEVNAVPRNDAGGAFATAIHAGMLDPILVMNVTADLGLDIGQTLIGMHLKHVAVPVRLSAVRLGEAVLTAARTRPPSIGGERAHYNPALK